MTYEAKLKTYKIRQEFKLAQELLARVETVEAVELYDGEDLSDIWELLKSTYNFEAIPNAKLDIESEKDEIHRWLSDLLKQAELDSESRLLLHIEQFRESLWLSVSVSSSHEWLPALWDKLDPRSLSICSPDLKKLLVFSDEEYDYLAFIFNRNSS